MQRTISEAMTSLTTLLEQDGGRFALSFNPAGTEDTKWLAALEWGREDDDSPMAGAAAYQFGTNAYEALNAVLDESGAK